MRCNEPGWAFMRRRSRSVSGPPPPIRRNARTSPYVEPRPVVARAAEAAAAEHGLGVGHHLVLKMLAAVGPRSQQVLSEDLRIDRSVMVGIADDLEKIGYVRRERDPEDRRAYAVTITASGRRGSRRPRRPSPNSSSGPPFAALTPTERDQLTTLLGKLLAAELDDSPRVTRVRRRQPASA
jgi:DNA-binding MarR family transcriptional regulator